MIRTMAPGGEQVHTRGPRQHITPDGMSSFTKRLQPSRSSSSGEILRDSIASTSTSSSVRGNSGPSQSDAMRRRQGARPSKYVCVLRAPSNTAAADESRALATRSEFSRTLLPPTSSATTTAFPVRPPARQGSLDLLELALQERLSCYSSRCTDVRRKLRQTVKSIHTAKETAST